MYIQPIHQHSLLAFIQIRFVFSFSFENKGSPTKTQNHTTTLQP